MILILAGIGWSDLVYAGNPVFWPARQDIHAGLNFQCIAAGDFNTDGNMDLVVVSYPPGDNGHKISLLLNDGNDTFSQSVISDHDTDKLCSGDYNGDGLMDFAAINYGSFDEFHQALIRPGNFVIFFNQGNGTFVPGSVFDDTHMFKDYAMVDLNGDGLQDFVFTVCRDGKLSWWFGQANGTFIRQAEIELEEALKWIATGDFNHDGYPDIAVTEYYREHCLIFLNDGTGQFNQFGQITLELAALDIISIDIDNDGYEDLVFNFCHHETDHLNMDVFRNNGDATFTFFERYPLHNYICVLKLLTADYTGDGYNDIAACWQNGLVRIFENNGNCTFTAAGDYGISGNGGRANLDIGNCDFNGDYRPDIIAGDADISILINKGDGTFPESNTWKAPAKTFGLETGDMNNDGIWDLVYGHEYGVTVLIDDGSGLFTDSVECPLGSSANDVILGDFNGDSWLDIAATQSNASAVAVFFNATNGTFTLQSHIPVQHLPSQIQIGEFNGDNAPDLAVINSGSDSISLLFNDGSGGFTTTDPIPANYSDDHHLAGLCTADFDGNDATDLVVVEGDLMIYYNQGNGVFSAPSFLGEWAGDIGFAGPLAVDINQDGNLDILVAGDIGSIEGGGVFVFLNNGSGIFESQNLFENRYGGERLTVADLNQDNLLDIIILCENANHVSVMWQSADGSFTEDSHRYGLMGYPVDLVSHDFNGDGYPDIAASNSTAENISILFNTIGNVPSCGNPGVDIFMPSHHFTPGSQCGCRATVCNPTDQPLEGYPLFVILEAFGHFFFAPGFTENVDSYLPLYPSIPPGETRVTVIPDFTWPAGVGAADNLYLYAALTTPDVSGIAGEMGIWEFGWSTSE